MAFISWRFAYPTEIIADWILIAMISTVAFGVYLLTKGYGLFIMWSYSHTTNMDNANILLLVYGVHIMEIRLSY